MQALTVPHRDKVLLERKGVDATTTIFVEKGRTEPRRDTIFLEYLNNNTGDSIRVANHNNQIAKIVSFIQQCMAGQVNLPSNERATFELEQWIADMDKYMAEHRTIGTAITRTIEDAQNVLRSFITVIRNINKGDHFQKLTHYAALEAYSAAKAK
jgi:hypothetical protein